MPRLRVERRRDDALQLLGQPLEVELAAPEWSVELVLEGVREGRILVLPLYPQYAGATTGTAQGKIKRIHKIVVRLFQTLGLKFGPNDSKLDVLPFRVASDPMDNPPPYLDDDTRDIMWNEGYTRSGRMYFRQDQPLPMTILAVMPEVVTQD